MDTPWPLSGRTQRTVHVLTGRNGADEGRRSPAGPLEVALQGVLERRGPVPGGVPCPENLWQHHAGAHIPRLLCGDDQPKTVDRTGSGQDPLVDGRSHASKTLMQTRAPPGFKGTFITLLAGLPSCGSPSAPRQEEEPRPFLLKFGEERVLSLPKTPENQLLWAGDK